MITILFFIAIFSGLLKASRDRYRRRKEQGLQFDLAGWIRDNL
jgi:hypothetical protein